MSAMTYLEVRSLFLELQFIVSFIVGHWNKTKRLINFHTSLQSNVNKNMLHILLYP